jgi:hypothetical protein
MFGEKFSSATGVFMHFEEQGVTPRTGDCGRCGARGHVFDWPLPGFGQRCAACIVIESGGHPDAA